MPDTRPNGWNEWSRHVLKELERLNACYMQVNTKIEQLRVDIAMLKVKSGIWGSIGAAVPILIGLLIWELSK